MNTEVRVLDAAGAQDLSDDILDRVRRHCESDADVAGADAAGLDLGVDTDDLASGVEQRASRVALVDRRVGLDDVVDRELVGSGELPLQRADDPGSRSAVEPEGLPIATTGSPTSTLSGCRGQQSMRSG
jgi:hypothetical protein